jgi:hypothetical protein
MDAALGTKELADNFKNIVTTIQSMEQGTRKKKQKQYYQMLNY